MIAGFNELKTTVFSFAIGSGSSYTSDIKQLAIDTGGNCTPVPEPTDLKKVLQEAFLNDSRNRWNWDWMEIYLLAPWSPTSPPKVSLRASLLPILPQPSSSCFDPMNFAWKQCPWMTLQVAALLLK
jgi:hypothetical protein